MLEIIAFFISISIYFLIKHELLARNEGIMNEWFKLTRNQGTRI